MSKLITVRKANRVIDVTENELERYLANGYVIRGEQPSKKVVAEPKPEVEKPVIEETKVVEETPVSKQVKAPTTGRKRKAR